MGEEKDVLQKVDMCARYLAKQLVDTNAETLRYTLEGFSFEEKVLGDFEIIVRKIT